STPSFSSFAGVETTATRPVLRLTMSSATSNTSFGFCSTSTIDKPLSFNLRIVAIDLRGHAFRWFVHQRHARIADQSAPDREHLLFSARKVRSDLIAAFVEA